MITSLALALLAVAAGGLAAVAGFGIGSLLTPALAILVGARLAVAAVSLPHLAGSALRLWLLRRHVDRRVLLGFGLASAAGGLAGAVLQGILPTRGLAVLFGAVVGLAGVSELSGWVSRRHWSRPAAWTAGVVSGLLGGLVGNQGGIRAAALLGFDVPKESFVATATAVALFVDAARVPVYLAALGPQLVTMWPIVLVLGIGVVVGTLTGTTVLGWLPERAFRRVVGVLLIALGVFMAVAGG
ncbi:MAG TPA: sulfite exporter TauE/SafE family protein [Candidatus Limnocylindrales bacterium]|nr:sulfite exporter TauE/SafE family protein [Candidatus Limnocylindrales bacterium]